MFLFVALILFTSTFLIITYIFFNKPLFDDEDLKFLNYGKLIMFILIIPFIEEFATRGIFALNNKVSIILFVVSTLIVVFIFVPQMWLSLSLALFTLIVGILSYYNIEFRNIINIFVKEQFIYFLLITSIIFGLLHLYNYETFDTHTFLKILPRILGGIYLGYIANKYGIMYSYLMHGINNLLPFIFVFTYTVLLSK